MITTHKTGHSLKPESVSEEIFLRHLDYHVTLDRVDPPDGPSGIVPGQSQAQTRATSQQLLRLLPSLLRLQVDLGSVSPSTAVFCRYYGECDLDSHCSYSLACYNNYCRDPCIGACGYNANCRVSEPVSQRDHVSRVSRVTCPCHSQVVNHVAACACPAGYSGNAASSCFKL